RMGVPFATVDPSKIVGIVEHEESDGVAPFNSADAVSEQIANHVVRFLADELRSGRVPPDFLPLQAGVGNIANAVMGALGRSPDIPPFYMYSEVLQDALIDLMVEGRCSAHPRRASPSASRKSSGSTPT